MFARAMLLVFVSASFAACQDNDCPGSALDRSPELKSSLDSFRKSVKTSGYAGRVVIDLTVRNERYKIRRSRAQPAWSLGQTLLTRSIMAFLPCREIQPVRDSTDAVQYSGYG